MIQYQFFLWFFFFFWHHDWGDLKHFFFPFEYIIYLTRSKKPCIGNHISLFFHQFVEKPHLERKERLTGNLADPSGAGGEMSARFKTPPRQNCYSAVLSDIPPPLTNSHNLKPSKRRKTTFLSQTESI